MRSFWVSSSLGLLMAAAFLEAQPSTSCGTTSVPPVVRSEGLSERIGDIVYVCTGGANLPITGNFTVALNTEITNRLSAAANLTGILFTVDSGSGPQPVLMQPVLINSNTLTYSGVTVSMPAQGPVIIRIAGIRANATRVPVGQQITALLALNGANLLGSTVQLPVGTPLKTLYAGFASSLICAQNGSPLPGELNFTNLIQRRTALSSIRFTEGFADAFGPRSAPAYFNADSGQRIIVRYSGFPSDARLFVPDVIAGSDAVKPTAGGDLGLAASGGAYVPQSGGSLLLARVQGAASNGAGGTPVYTPGPEGSGTVTFNSVSELQLQSGSAYVVYEVVDANPSRIESAQFPTFLGLLPDGNRPTTQTDAHIYVAPSSTIATASAIEPLPRFPSFEPEPDCSLIGDCATYLPQLTIDSGELSFTASSPGTQRSYFLVRNTGGGAMHWTTSIAYTNGSGWLSLQPSEGINNTTVQVFASPQNLAPGTYKATITVNGGQYTTPNTLPVTFVVPSTPLTKAPVPVIDSVLNAASFAAVAAVPGSISTVMGSALSGKDVTATFNGVPATILYNNGKQINLLVPAELASSGSAGLVITTDGVASEPRTVTLAAFAPAIFGGAFNQDTTVNSVANPSEPGSVAVVFATGLSGSGRLTARIHDRDVDVPYYAGPAPGFPGVQQVNVRIPEGLHGMSTDLFVCGTTASPEAKSCSPPVQVSIK